MPKGQFELPFSIYTFEYRDKLDDGKRHIGLMADEVEKVCPTAIVYDPNGWKMVNYSLLGTLYPGMAKLLQLFPNLIISDEEIGK